ncbi:hypothetical protein [Pseudobutyrivibrio xylanivorans]|uniref:Uncharacterized protein n=1 Tax=Pseudobutyrivibrio xylanivorans TaxID=185007 RepID=A0A1G5S102_PSEXY|nr:hypothetical protein [Pseudobutyrivibrio xylanivorans]SCZ79818.1 hypothetical protein SAMN02910350_01986 [Pseudobutyrivibrio xylanivorans]
MINELYNCDWEKVYADYWEKYKEKGLIYRRSRLQSFLARVSEWSGRGQTCEAAGNGTIKNVGGVVMAEMNTKTMYKLSYGLFVCTAVRDGR